MIPRNLTTNFDILARTSTWQMEEKPPPGKRQLFYAAQETKKALKHEVSLCHLLFTGLTL